MTPVGGACATLGGPGAIAAVAVKGQVGGDYAPLAVSGPGST